MTAFPDGTIGSLFSGIGGLEMGLEAAGLGHVVWQVEANPYCRDVLARHWPNADRSVTDVRLATAANLASVDAICGGFPCQDISVAGKGAGLAGARSGLWFEFARIVGELRPRIVVVENVAALAIRGLDTVLGSLAALGYDAVWTTLRAADVGAPHRRERLFIVAYTNGVGRKTGQTRQLFGRQDASGHDLDRLRPRHPEPGLGRATHGVSGRVDRRWPSRPGEPQQAWEAPRTVTRCKRRAMRLRALGNAVVPQCAELAGVIAKEVSHA